MISRFSRCLVSAGALLLGAAAASVACSNGSDLSDTQTPCSGAQCAPDAGADAPAEGSTADSAAPDAPPACVPTSQSDEPDDAYHDANCDGIDGDASAAVFLSPDGSDSAAGTSDAPVKTFAEALKRAASAKKDVYACIGTYTENVVLGASHSARVFGGYDCKNDWRRGEQHALVAPVSGLPLYLEAANDLSMEQVDFRAQAASLPSDSSVAAVIKASLGVKFRRGVFTAGNGADGNSGSVGTAFAGPAPGGLDGASAPETCSKSAPAGNCQMQAAGGGVGAVPHTCVSGSIGTTGGKGGKGGNVMLNVAPEDGGFGLPIGGNGGKVNGVSTGLAGKAGAPGAHGLPGSDFGVFVDGKYDATNAGTDGSVGANGLAGGGGAGGKSAWGCPDVFSCYFRGGGGGQGGFGGCGGPGGTAGGGGGGSFAMVLINSPVALKEVTLRSGNGGNGGPGAAGALGQTGGAHGKGGVATSGHAGFDGGKGGNGGPGGIGGPGGGGPSFGIVYLGTPHSIDAVTFEVGVPGLGGAALSGPSAPAGLGGLSLEIDASGLPKN